MKNKIEKIIKEDYNNSYSFKVDKNKLYKNLNIDRNSIKVNPFWKKLSYGLIVTSMILLCMLSIVTAWGIKYIVLMNTFEPEGTSEEFIEYTKDYDCETIKLHLFLKPDSDFNLYIHKGFNENNKIYYFYYVIMIEDWEVYIITDKTEFLVHNNSYGILDIIEDSSDDILKFSLSINGEIKNYILN